MHKKQSISGESPDNNGWIYSAIARAVGIHLSQQGLRETFEKCVVRLKTGFILINRLPEKEEPPLSHDELIGQYLLGMISYDLLKSNHFVYHGPGRAMNFKTIGEILTGLFKLLLVTYVRGKFHRNLFWEYEIKEMNQLAFRLTPNYVYFLKMDNAVEPHLEEKIYWKLYCKTTIESGSPGSKNILFAMAKRLGDEDLINKIQPHESLGDYFGTSHPIYLAFV